MLKKNEEFILREFKTISDCLLADIFYEKKIMQYQIKKEYLEFIEKYPHLKNKGIAGRKGKNKLNVSVVNYTSDNSFEAITAEKYNISEALVHHIIYKKEIFNSINILDKVRRCPHCKGRLDETIP